MGLSGQSRMEQANQITSKTGKKVTLGDVQKDRAAKKTVDGLTGGPRQKIASSEYDRASPIDALLMDVPKGLKQKAVYGPGEGHFSVRKKRK